jgi:2-polyprenyl-3-methyl-5-hydroxy-6-metoxy-1,4-benzoquinol methylase
MKQIQYDGFELEHFDSAYNFRKYQVSLIKEFLDGSLLEVGAGKGGLTAKYIGLLDKITLIEPDKKLFNFLKKKFKKKKILIKNSSIKNIKKKFDVIIYFDVLEHIKKDSQEIKLASKKLNENGYLIFSVPAFQIFYSDFDKFVGHFKRYHKSDFLEFSKKNNLKIIKLVYYDSIGFLFLILNKIFSLKQSNLKSKVFLWNILIPISKILDILTFNTFGKSLLCVLKKKN